MHLLGLVVHQPQLVRLVEYRLQISGNSDINILDDVNFNNVTLTNLDGSIVVILVGGQSTQINLQKQVNLNYHLILHMW